MRKTIEIPDKEIELSHGDRVEIFVRKNEIAFSVFCNQDGCCFGLTREELMQMLGVNNLKGEIVSIIQDCIDKCNIPDCAVCENYKALIKRINERK